MDNKKKPAPVLPFRGGPPGMGGGVHEKPKNFKKTIKRIVGYLRPYWGHLIFVLICAVISTVFAIASPKVLGNMTTEIVKGLISHKGIDFNNIAMIGFWLIALYLISALFSYV